MDASQQVIDQAYAEHELQVGLRRIKWGCYFAVPALILGWLVDCWLYPSQKVEFLLTRVVFAVAMTVTGIAGTFAIPRSCVLKKHYQAVGVALAMIPSGCMAWIVYRTGELGLPDGGVASPYYEGLILVLLAIGLILQWNFVQSLVAVGGVLLMWTFAVHATWDLVNNPPLLVTHLWFLILTGIIVVWGNTHYSNLRRRDFEANYRLKQSQQETETANAQLAESNQQLEEKKRPASRTGQVERPFLRQHQPRVAHATDAAAGAARAAA
jgi:hypothetical protein